MTAPDQPKASPMQRVTDRQIADFLALSLEGRDLFETAMMEDLRDTRAALADAQTALAARYARIAELEKDLRLLRDAVARVASWDWTEKCCDEAAYAHHSMVKLAGCHEREDELIGFEEELAAANARADRLEAQLQAARAAGTREEEQSQAATDVLTERRRQVEVEGWIPEHDDVHSTGEMADAAACYASTHADLIDRRSKGGVVPRRWPWSRDWWKPGNRRRMLVKAGALILAEIERLDRARLTAPAEPTADTGEKG